MAKKDKEKTKDEGLEEIVDLIGQIPDESEEDEPPAEPVEEVVEVEPPEPILLPEEVGRSAGEGLIPFPITEEAHENMLKFREAQVVGSVISPNEPRADFMGLPYAVPGGPGPLPAHVPSEYIRK